MSSCCKPGNCLIKFCALLPPLEDDPPDPGAAVDEPDDAAAVPAIAEDAGIPGDLVDIALPDEIGEAVEIMPAAGLAVSTDEFLVTDAAWSPAGGILDGRP